MIRLLSGWGLALLLLLAAACSSASPPAATTVAATATAPAAAPTAAVNPPVTPIREGPITLRIWLPPNMDPQSGTPAGDLLAARLEEFTARRPDIRIETRLKALDGPAGMLESLAAASTAAPLALPDLVALPRPMLESAALKGLLRSYDELSDSIEDPDWFDYARQLGQVQNSIFGLPFAGDALALVYRRATVPVPPRTITDTLSLQSTLAFPAADPQALFTLSQYLVLGGVLQDEQGRPVLDGDTLGELLGYYDQSARAEITPYWLTQFQTDEQAWQSFRDGQVELVVTWVSRYLQDPPEGSSASLLPTPHGEAFTLASGWAWALVSPNVEHHRLSAQLAEFLSEAGYIANWTQAAGLLPTRPSALHDWQSALPPELAQEMLASAQLIPASDLLTILGPPLQLATAEVLKQQLTPLTAAQNAAASLEQP